MTDKDDHTYEYKTVTPPPKEVMDKLGRDFVGHWETVFPFLATSNSRTQRTNRSTRCTRTWLFSRCNSPRTRTYPMNATRTITTTTDRAESLEAELS